MRKCQEFSNGRECIISQKLCAYIICISRFNLLSHLHLLVTLFLNSILLLRYALSKIEFNLNVKFEQIYLSVDPHLAVKAISAARQLYRSPTIRVQDS